LTTDWKPSTRRRVDSRRQSDVCREAQARKRERQVDQFVRVPNEPFRTRFLLLQKEGAITLGNVARALGWVYPHSPRELERRGRRHDRITYKADTTRVSRMLGLRPESPGGYKVGQPVVQDSIPYDDALRLAEILGMDPIDCGL
jgi:hypothetical protein